jgi:hypothetical protein
VSSFDAKFEIEDLPHEILGDFPKHINPRAGSELHRQRQVKVPCSRQTNILRLIRVGVYSRFSLYHSAKSVDSSSFTSTGFMVQDLTPQDPALRCALFTDSSLTPLFHKFITQLRQV